MFPRTVKSFSKPHKVKHNTRRCHGNTLTRNLASTSSGGNGPVEVPRKWHGLQAEVKLPNCFGRALCFLSSCSHDACTQRVPADPVDNGRCDRCIRRTWHYLTPTTRPSGYVKSSFPRGHTGGKVCECSSQAICQPIPVNIQALFVSTNTTAKRHTFSLIHLSMTILARRRE
ncbi:hypothetical protein EDC04DRAFT_1405683 [Pisolithus marmoratus]|nr:hypothetical protein EDC04DRAFT_1405683 [Pisolithus marmoratus]